MRKIAVVVVLVAAVAALAWRFYFSGPDEPLRVIELSGRIEGDEAAVSPRISGRVVELTVREGDKVEKGQLIAVLTDEGIRAREEQARAAVNVAESRMRAAQQQIAVLNQQLRQAQIGVGQARTEAAGRVREAEANVAAAEAQLAQAEASYKIAAFDRDAYQRLAATGAASERQARQAASQAGAQAAAVESARKRVDAAKASLAAAQAMLANPEVRTAQAGAVEQQIAQARIEVATAQAEAARARAALQEAEANRSDLRVVAPFAGTIATRTAEPGEFAPVGTPLVTIVDLDQLYMRGFVAEGQIGLVRLGQPARVFLDSAPEKPLTAEVSRIDPQAAFTPENTYFREDRVKQVVGVKLALKRGDGFAKPGMPADGNILVEGTQWPSETR